MFSFPVYWQYLTDVHFEWRWNITQLSVQLVLTVTWITRTTQDANGPSWNTWAKMRPTYYAKNKTGSSPFATEHPNHWSTLTMEVIPAL